MIGIYCVVAITLLISSIYLSLVPANKNLFIKFQDSLNIEQKKIYDNIVYEKNYDLRYWYVIGYRFWDTILY